eukprot:scaffold4077_cov101-Isochrysis_galbana.AAC.1
MAIRSGSRFAIAGKLDFVSLSSGAYRVGRTAIRALRIFRDALRRGGPGGSSVSGSERPLGAAATGSGSDLPIAKKSAAGTERSDHEPRHPGIPPRVQARGDAIPPGTIY